MAHLRNPRLSRILEAMESKKDSVSTENPELISMDDLDYNFSRDANPITVDTCRSPSLLQEQALPESVSHTMEADVQPVDDGIPNPYLSGTGFQELTPEDLTRPTFELDRPSSRARSNSTSSKSSSSSSSTSSSSSSSSCASESGKDFSPDEADCDADYVPATPPRRVLFSPTPQNSISVQLVEENNLGPPEQNRTPNKRRRKGFPKASVRQDAKRLRNSGLAVKKCLRSGPVYTPDQYVTIIRTARKKGNPYNVTEMCYSDFVDIKNLTEICGAQFSKNIEGGTVKMSDIKIMKFEKHQNFNHVGIYYKTSYSDTDFKEIQFRNNRSSRTCTSTDLQDFQLKPLYQSRLKLSDRKNSDLKSLINSNIIPQSYALSYYNSILF